MERGLKNQSISQDALSPIVEQSLPEYFLPGKSTLQRKVFCKRRKFKIRVLCTLFDLTLSANHFIQKMGMYQLKELKVSV